MHKEVIAEFGSVRECPKCGFTHLETAAAKYCCERVERVGRGGLESTDIVYNEYLELECRCGYKAKTKTKDAE